MNYRKIPQSVADKLKPLEAYVYLVLASKSDFKTNESNVNEDISSGKNDVGIFSSFFRV